MEASNSDSEEVEPPLDPEEVLETEDDDESDAAALAAYEAVAVASPPDDSFFSSDLWRSSMKEYTLASVLLQGHVPHIALCDLVDDSDFRIDVLPMILSPFSTVQLRLGIPPPGCIDPELLRAFRGYLKDADAAILAVR